MGVTVRVPQKQEELLIHHLLTRPSKLPNHTESLLDYRTIPTSGKGAGSLGRTLRQALPTPY